MLSHALGGTAVLKAVVSCEEIVQAQEELKTVRICQTVQDSLLDLAAATRESDAVRTGISPRGLLALADASRGYAAIHGRDYVIPDDVKAVAPDVIAHRLILKGASFADRLEEKRKLTQQLLEQVPVPKDQIWNC